MMGEDNPLVGPPTSPMPGYNEEMWLEYTRRIVDLFASEFHQTDLEFDIARLSWMYALGTETERTEVDDFVKSLLAKRVLLAFDGLESSSLAHLNGKQSLRDGFARSLGYLRYFKQLGGRIGLEAIGPLTAPRMANVEAIVEAIKDLRPDRLVFFSDLPNAVHLRMNDKDIQNEMTHFGSNQNEDEIYNKANYIIGQLGYKHN